MGGANIDLRQAELEGPEVTITIVSIMGGSHLIVPEGVDVELTGLSIMGGKDYRPGKQALPPGAPSVHVRAYSVMGGVSVVTKR
jgi:predicted membrane protein